MNTNLQQTSHMRTAAAPSARSIFHRRRQTISGIILAALLCSEPGPRAWAEAGDTGTGDSQTGVQPGCYNEYDPSKFCEECQDGEVTSFSWPSSLPCPATGVNPVNIATGDVQREVRDIVALAGVGTHRLHWTRYGHSRFVGGGRVHGRFRHLITI